MLPLPFDGCTVCGGLEVQLIDSIDVIVTHIPLTVCIFLKATDNNPGPVCTLKGLVGCWWSMWVNMDSAHCE